MTKHRVFEVFFEFFRRVAKILEVLRPKMAHLAVTHCDVVLTRSAGRCVATKDHSTQWDGGLRHSATLLLLKIKNNVHIHTYAYAYRGIVGTGFKVLRLRAVGGRS